MKISNFLSKWLLLPLVILTFSVSDAWGVDYEKMLTLDLASASDGVNTEITKDSDLKTFLQSATPASTDITSATIDGGKIYDAKGDGGTGIPAKVLKIGTASGPGSFSFTIADSYALVTKVVITGYGWKTTTAVSVNSSASQSPDTKLVERTFTYELKSGSKTISIAVSTSALCATKIELYKTAATVPCSTNPTAGTASLNGTFSCNHFLAYLFSLCQRSLCSIFKYRTGVLLSLYICLWSLR